MPRRIKLERRRGWRKPEGAVVVARPTTWGNPWKVGSTTWTVNPDGTINRQHPPLTAQQAVDAFRNLYVNDPELVAAVRRELAGRDLACWCPLVGADGKPVPCHADVLLEISNCDLSDLPPEAAEKVAAQLTETNQREENA